MEDDKPKTQSGLSDYWMGAVWAIVAARLQRAESARKDPKGERPDAPQLQAEVVAREIMDAYQIVHATRTHLAKHPLPITYGDPFGRLTITDGTTFGIVGDRLGYVFPDGPPKIVVARDDEPAS